MIDQDSITKNELVDILDNYLFGWAFKDLEKIYKYTDAPMSVFILGSCFIDAMASFYHGVTKQNEKMNIGERYREFVRKYLGKYKPEDLWSDLRCNLVHSYTTGKTYAFTHHNNGGFHLDSTSDGKVIINFEDFLSDLRTAYGKFRKDILFDNDIFLKVRQRYNDKGLLQPVKQNRGK